MQCYDFNNLQKNFGISFEEASLNGNPRVVATSQREALFEYLENSDTLPSYPAKDDRLVILD